MIARIFYNVNRSWSGQISLAELRHSNLLATIRLLEEEDDINQITDFFSYEHFYVIYCKFWELDKDHDLFIDKKDLARHNDHGTSEIPTSDLFCLFVFFCCFGSTGLSAHLNEMGHRNLKSNRVAASSFFFCFASRSDQMFTLFCRKRFHLPVGGEFSPSYIFNKKRGLVTEFRWVRHQVLPNGGGFRGAF